MGKEYKFRIPVEGIITVSIPANDPEEAINILIEKQEEYTKHPLGKLELLLEDAIVIENSKIVN